MLGWRIAEDLQDIACKGKIFIFKLIAGLLWLVFSIIDALAWNGFVRAANFDKDGYGGFVFLSVVESLLLLFGFLLMPVCVYKVHTFIADAGIPSAPGLWLNFIIFS